MKDLVFLVVLLAFVGSLIYAGDKFMNHGRGPPRAEQQWCIHVTQKEKWLGSWCYQGQQGPYGRMDFEDGTKVTYGLEDMK